MNPDNWMERALVAEEMLKDLWGQLERRRNCRGEEHAKINRIYRHVKWVEDDWQKFRAKAQNE